MNKKIAFAVALIIVLSAAIFLVWTNLEYSSATKHETNRWAVIQDVDNNVLSVETTNDEIWTQLVQLNANGTRMWVGGEVQRYDNKWGFRFKPETIIIAQFTIEAAQALIRFISDDIDYWINFGITYVGSIVIEIHET
jgi:hypothetical protein